MQPNLAIERTIQRPLRALCATAYVERTVPAYVWSCLACGTANQPSVLVCQACSCPAEAKYREIEHFRETYELGGGTPLAGAAHLREADWPAGLLFVYGVLAVVLLGAWPFTSSRARKNGA